MKRLLILGLMLLLAAWASPVLAQGGLTYAEVFPGVACTEHWETDMYIMIDQSRQGENPRWTMAAEFIPSHDNDVRYATTFDLADYGNNIIYSMRDFVCRFFPQVEGNGTLLMTSQTPFYAWHASIRIPQEYGSSVPPSYAVSSDFLYVWFGDTIQDNRYRFNVFLFNAHGSDPAFVWVNSDLYALEPLESLTILRTTSSGTIDIMEGNNVHITVSQVNNTSNDGFLCPLIRRYIF